MATNLQFIKSASGTSVSSLDVTDCFSANYDVYKVLINNDNTGNNAFKIRVINSSDVTKNVSSYDYASLQLNASASFGEDKNTNFNEFRGLGFEALTGAVSTIYFFNPFSSSSYTFATSQIASFYTTNYFRGGKAIGVYKVAESITGLHIFETGSSFTHLDVAVYGVK